MKIPHRQRMGDRNAPKTRRMMGRTGRLGGFPGDFPAEGLAGRPLRAMRAPFMRAAALFIHQRGIFLFAPRHATSLLRPPARGRSRLLVATDWLKGFSHPFGPSLRPPIRGICFVPSPYHRPTCVASSSDFVTKSEDEATQVGRW